MNDDLILKQIEKQISEISVMNVGEIITDIAHGETAELFDKWKKLFTSHSIKNESLAHFTMHTILGQKMLYLPLYLNSEKIDLRCHVLFQQDSGSGKSTGWGVVKNICNKIGIPSEIMQGQMSDVALVGGYEKTKDGEDVRTPGKLEQYKEGGILTWDEVKFLIMSLKNEWSHSSVSYLTSAMNSFWTEPNKIKRILKASMTSKEQIEYNCKTSFIFTSFPIALDIETFVNSGFIQRVIPIYSRLTEEKWKDMTKGVNEAIINSQTVDRIKIDNRLKLMSDEISAIIKAKDNTRYLGFLFEVGVKEQTEKFIDDMTGMIRGISLSDKNIFNTFRIRSLVNMYKFAFHYAWAKSKPISRHITIDIESINYASEIMKSVFKNFLEYLEWSYYGEVEDSSLKRFNVLTRNMKVLESLQRHIIETAKGKFSCWLTEEFITVVANLFKMSDGSIRNILTDWQDRGLVRRYGGRGKEKSYITF